MSSGQQITINIKDSTKSLGQLKIGEFFKFKEQIWIKVHNYCLPISSTSKHLSEVFEKGAAFSMTKNRISYENELHTFDLVLPATQVEINLTFEQ